MAKQAKTADSSVKAAQATSENAVTLLSSDHRKVESLFAQFTSATDEGRKAQLVHQICIELTVHAMLEEELFYAECRTAGVETEPLDEAQVEHDGAKILIQDLLKQRPGNEFYEAKVVVLREQIKHHVAEEEKPDEGIFARAKAAGMNLEELGKRIKERKTELMGRAERPDFRPPRVRWFYFGT